MKSSCDFLRTTFSALAFTSIPNLLVKNVNAAESKIVKQTQLAMGTIVSFTASHTAEDEAYSAFAKAFEEIQRLEKIFSRHDTSSALSVLNSEGKLSYAPKEMIYLVNQSIEIAGNTNNIYNPAVKPLLDLFESNQDINLSAKNITRSEIKDAQELINLSDVKTSNNSIHFAKSGMGITLDSIAKGYIIDRASEILTLMNVKNHIINAGGDIIAKGRKSKSEAWIVGIENPQNPSQMVKTFELQDMAIATSGSYQKYFDKNAQRHHIINPMIAQSPEIVTISCKAKTAMLADAYSTVNSLVTDSIYSNYIV